MEDSFAVVESVKAAADIYIPVDGRVLEINEDPYENWMILVELEDKSQLDELMDHEEYEKFLEEEV